MMLLAQHPDFSGLASGVLRVLFLGVAIPLALVASLTALGLVAAGRRGAASTRFFAFGSLALIVPASLLLLWVSLHPDPTSPSPFGVVWQIMAVGSFLCSAAASLVASRPAA